MTLNRKTTSLLVISIALGCLSSPLLATFPKSDEIDSGFADIRQIEIMYPRFVQAGFESIDSQPENGGDPETNPVSRGPEVPASTEVTALIIKDLEDAEAICGFVDDVYQISCFSETYRKLAEDIPSNGDYAEARETLLDAARKLDDITRRNLDRQKPALTARLQKGGGQTVTTPPIRAVRSDRVTQLKQQAANVMQEAETVLLRSASSDAKRAIHYQRIAAVVESNKVLLRSG